MGLTPFSIHLSPSPSENRIEVDGEDVTRLISRVTVDSKHENGISVPHVYLELIGEGTLEGEGVIHDVRQVPADPIPVILDWLGNLDAEELEKCILDQFGAFGEETTGQTCLAVLKAWARGD